jgi:hypothetical protein
MAKGVRQGIELGYTVQKGMSLTKLSLDGNNSIIPNQGEFGK